MIMTTAIIIAGGSGIRMGESIPKQFIKVLGKPVMMYTLEGFQNHPLIDNIEVVCLDGWIEYLCEEAKKNKISELYDSFEMTRKNFMSELESEICTNGKCSWF